MASSYSQSDRRTELFISGLKNAHALEKQAISIMTPQVARLEHYPEMRDRLQAHIEETRGQIARLDQLLERMGTSSSMIKDMGLSMAGGMAAIGHSAASDEVLKNSFANMAFENFEIASYKSLITMSEALSIPDAGSLLTQTLQEEQSMARFIDDNLAMVTRRYMELYAEEGAMEAKV
jgi:ferritin-like metal-binding protein YciE